MSLSHGFEKQREDYIGEIDCLATLYRHRKSGAELMSLSARDENKVFGVSFRTPPDDSTGIAHIMEHSVLCGSRKYPVKAPFLEMLKSSLNTFLNAMTFPDKTVYPVASTNLQDFYNLVDVYLDAVLHPRITPDILKQEGWHYELDGPDGPLTFKGVVFNEMKGSYSSPDDRVRRLSQRSLYPDTTYGVDSGGDPAEIPNLTYEAFKRFHERFYHPSNAKFFFYGDDDPDKRLEILDRALSEFSAIEVDSGVELQERFPTPLRERRAFPASPEAGSARQAQVTVNWMLDEIRDPETGLALGVLNEILLGSSAAPLRKALIDSRLGEGLTGSGLGSWSRQPSFSTGLKGVAAGDADKVEALILDTLEKLAVEGIDPLTVEAAINTAEFRLRENNTGSFPRGMAIMFRALQFWNYGRSPLEPLSWEAPLERLKARLGAGERVFEDMIRTHLTGNAHRTTVLFEPDPGLAVRETAEERARLDAAKAAMSAEEIAQVIEDTRRIRALQEKADSPEALAAIPRLTLADLPEKHAAIPCEIREVAGVKTLTHELPANGVIYAEIGLDLRQLPGELLPFVGIFRRALLETGAGDKDMVALSQTIGRTTGGISALGWTSAIVNDSDPAAWLILRGKTMPDKASGLGDLLTDILTSARLGDTARIAQIVDEERAAMESRLIPAGFQFIGTRLRAALGKADWATEQMGGVSYLLALREFAETMKSDPARITEALERIRSLLLRREGAIFNVTADAEGLRAAESVFARLAGALSTERSALHDWPLPEAPRVQGLTIPAKVNYVAKGADLTQLGYSPGGAAMVASHWLRGGWLWEKVRVQGGAYGGFSALDEKSGLFNFASYRDPNLARTLAVYDGAGQYLRDEAANDQAREQAIIGTIGKIDAYRLPDAKGFTSLLRHLSGANDVWLESIRNEVLQTTAEDIRGFADALDAVARDGRIVVMGAEDSLASASHEMPEPFSLTRLT